MIENDWDQVEDGDDWVTLLSVQPQFADECQKQNGFFEMSCAQRSDLLHAQPELAKYIEKAEKAEEVIHAFFRRTRSKRQRSILKLSKI